MTFLEKLEDWLSEHNRKVVNKKILKVEKQQEKKYVSRYVFSSKDDNKKIPLWLVSTSSLVIKQIDNDEIVVVKSRFFKPGTYVYKYAIKKGEDK